MIKLFAATFAVALWAAPALAQPGDHVDTGADGALDKQAQATGEHVDADQPEDVHHGGGDVHHAAPAPINWLDFGYRKKDVHGGTLEAGEEPMAPPLAMALLNFAIFVGLLVKFAGPKLTGYLRGRHDTITRDLAEAARLRKEAGDKLAEYSSRLAKVNAEVDQLIAEIRADADAEKARILEEARSQAAAMKKDAEERIASEFARARLELEREVVGAAVAAAERLLRDKATPADQQALFDGFVSNLKPSTPSGTPAPTGGATDVSKGWS